MKMKIVELRRKHAELLAEARKLADGELTDETRAETDGLIAQADVVRADIEREERLEAMLTSHQAPALRVAGGVGGSVIPRGWTEERMLKVWRPDAGEARFEERREKEIRAAAHYLRTGEAGPLNEVRAYNNTDMNVGTAADGGYAVPTGLYNSIIARRDEALLAPRLGVQDIPGKGTTVRVPVDAEADVLFTTEAEAGAIDQDAPALYYKDFTLAKYAKYITLSWELLRDEDAKLMAFVNNWIARGVAATHNNALVTEALASGTAGLTLDSATAIGSGEIPELVGKLAPEYQDGAWWILKPTTVAYIQGLAGTSNWYFSPVPQNFAGWPTLWSFPVAQSSYASAYEASAKSLIFGNFSFMGVREETQLTMLRDPYSAAANGQVRLWFWFDMVYGVLQAEAIQYATHPTG